MGRDGRLAMLSYIDCMRQIHVYILLFFLHFSAILHAEELPVAWEYTQTSNLAATISEMKQFPAAQWFSVPHKMASLGFTSKPIWIRTTLASTEGGLHILELVNPPLDEVTLYLLRNDGHLESYPSGAARPWPDWQTRYHNLIFPIRLQAGEQAVIYLKIRNAEATLIQPKIHRPNTFADQTSKERFWIGLFVGVFLALGVYSLMIWLGTRDRDFLNYFLFTAALGLLQTNLIGILHELFLYRHPDWMDFSRTLFPVLAYLAYIQFSQQFLNLAHYSPRSNQAFRLCAWTCYLLLPTYAIWGNSVSVPLATAIGMILILMGISSGFVAWSRGFRPARFYLLAKTALFLGGFFFILTAFGAIPASLGTVYGFHMGAIGEAFLIAFSLSDKINTMSKERSKAQSERLVAEKKVIETLRESEAKLEDRVKERTQQLEQALDLQHEQAQALQKTNLNLQTLNEDKNAYMGIAAHDLKNPTAAIIGFIDLLVSHWEGWDAQKKLERLGNVRELAIRINEIIRKLLDVNAIESGGYTLTPAAVDLAACYEQVVAGYASHLEKKNMRIVWESQTLSQVWIDRDALLQVLDNLISNAIKYSPPGHTIHIGFSNWGQQAEIRIQDEGPGIATEEQTQLFRKFTRLSARPTAGEHSTGLGLYIVKKILDASNATIRCESRLGEGTTFIVRLPLTPTGPSASL